MVLESAKHTRNLFEISQDKSDNNLECIHTYLDDSPEETNFECRTDEIDFAITWTSPVTLDTSSESSFINQEQGSVDEDLSRRRIWKLIVKDKPVPDPEDDAIEKYSGILNQLFDDEDDSDILIDILQELRGK